MNNIDSVSIVLKSDDEYFMIRRQPYLKAFPGYHAFPGGKIDEGDDLLFQEANNWKLDPRVWGALVREAIEELDYNIAEHVLQGNIKDIRYLGVARTPSFNPYRYVTAFVLIDMALRPNFNVDEREAELYFWKGAQDFVNDYSNGDLLVVPPIINLLRILVVDNKNQNDLDFSYQYNENKEVPGIESLAGIYQLMPLSGTLPPAERTNSFIIGESKKILIDPSPVNEEEFQKFMYSIKNQKIDEVFLTHHHYDHHKFSPIIAKKLSATISMSEDTFSRIKQKRGANYFTDLKVDTYKEGDIVTTWLGEQVHVYEVPGHDEGQLALAPKSMKWFLVGDLIQGIGTVVIGGDESDMIKYMKSLDRVIALNPQTIIPSHGIILGSTNRLIRTKTHREKREEQVLQLFNIGKTIEEITQTIYYHIDPRLMVHAQENVHSHVKKLKIEGKLNV